MTDSSRHFLRLNSYFVWLTFLVAMLLPLAANATTTSNRQMPPAIKAGFEPKRANPINDLLVRLAIDDVLADIHTAEIELLRLPALPKVGDTQLVNIDGIQRLLLRHKLRALELRSLPNTPEKRSEIDQMTLMILASRRQIKFLQSRFRAGDMLDSRSSLCGDASASRISCGRPNQIGPKRD